MIHLRSAELSQIPPDRKARFPFTVPLFQKRTRIELSSPVTIIVGENGSGKSTLIEALAVAINARTIGSQPVAGDRSLADVAHLGKAMKLVWSRRTNEGFFLRAEDFFGFVKRIDRIKEELEEEKKALSHEFKDRSEYARSLALLPYHNELAALKNFYGEGLDTLSHGESFLKLFQSRLKENGLYLLDEPETPLSPIRQLGLIAQLREMEKHNCQFIVATHSPILMAYPGATILLIEDGNIRQVSWNELEHVTLTRDFLNDPDSFLRHL